MVTKGISGAHLNPCITVAYILGDVKDGSKFNRLVGFLYIGVQFAAASGAALLAKFFTAGKSVDGASKASFSLSIGEDDDA